MLSKKPSPVPASLIEEDDPEGAFGRFLDEVMLCGRGSSRRGQEELAAMEGEILGYLQMTGEENEMVLALGEVTITGGERTLILTTALTIAPTVLVTSTV